MWVQIIIIFFVFIIIGYGFGNILFGPILAKAKNKNIRSIGSTNVGGTNVARTSGVVYGLLVMFLDSAKAYLAICLCLLIFWASIYKWQPDNGLYGLTIFIPGVFAVLGHCFPVTYMFVLMKTKDKNSAQKYKGGKGVASACGVVCAISPFLALCGLVIFFIVLFTSKYVSLASMITTSSVTLLSLIPWLDYIYLLDNNSFPLYSNYFRIDEEHWTYWVQFIIFMFLLVISVVVIVRHIPNIKKIKDKSEHKIY